MRARWLLVAAALLLPAVVAGLVLGTPMVVLPVLLASGALIAAVVWSMRSRVVAVASERERSMRLLEGLSSAVLLFDGGRLAYANAAARQLLDLEGPAVGIPARMLEVDGIADIIERAHSTAQEAQIDVAHRGRSLEVRAVPTSAGEVAVTVSDLTDVRRVEAVRRDFVTNASHELKTPIAGIQALSESLELAISKDPERARRMIGRLQNESVRLATLVRDLLDLARLEESATERGRSEVSVTDVVRGQIERLSPVARERNVKVRADTLEEISLQGVPEDVRLIAGNVIENAVRYNRDAGRVDISLWLQGSEAVLRVSDTGVGISPEEQSRVFERFYRIDKARSRAAGGTGLGLSLVRHAVQRANGRIELDSVVGEGSTFTVLLPVDPPAPSAD